MSRLVQERAKKYNTKPPTKIKLNTLTQQPLLAPQSHNPLPLDTHSENLLSLGQENIQLKQQIILLSQQVSSNPTQQNTKRAHQQYTLTDKVTSEQSQIQQESIEKVALLCQKIQTSFNEHFSQQLDPFTKIASRFLDILSQDPRLNSEVTATLTALQDKIGKLTQSTLQQEFTKRLSELKEELRKQREQLKQSIGAAISENLKVYAEREKVRMQNQQQILASIPSWIKELKDGVRKKEEEHKQQLSFLQQKIIKMNQANKQTLQSQNKLIKYLKSSLQNLKEIYHKEIQIPINSIRESVQGQINKMKSQLQNTHSKSSITTLVKDPINTLTQFTESKQKTNYNQMHQQISKIGERINTVQTHSTSAVSEIKQLVGKISHERLSLNLTDRIKKADQFVVCKKKEREELEMEAKYYKQKQYIEILEKYNKKLEQSVIRTQKDKEKNLYSQWKQIEQHYSARDKQLKSKLSSLDEQLSKGMTDIVQIKKTVFSILQTQKTLASCSQSLEKQLTGVKEFKDQLFVFLQTEFTFIVDINKQIQTFNQIFIREYNELTQLHQSLPALQPESNPINYQQFQQSLSNKMEAFSNFKQEYAAVFKNKIVCDFKLSKNLSALAQFHEEYLMKSKKEKEQVIHIQVDFMPIKNHINTAINQIDYFISNTKLIKQHILKDVQVIKQSFQHAAQSFQQISKSIRQSKLRPTIESIFECIESQKQIFDELKLVLNKLAEEEGWSQEKEESKSIER